MFGLGKTPKIQQETLPNPFSKKYLFEPQYRDDIFDTLTRLISEHGKVDWNGAILDPVSEFLHGADDVDEHVFRMLKTVDRRKLRGKQKAVYWSTWNYIEENRVPNARKWVKWKVRGRL